MIARKDDPLDVYLLPSRSEEHDVLLFGSI